ncbi:MAG: hypothetical protein DLM70_07610 [Chloroflexi bacterium]|nr:MAG: hypothetical protein DLM70_07610 [Chloroflexota bacterium]
MGAVNLKFWISEEDRNRLEHLVDYFARGNRSAFLHLAMKRMETLERTERFRDLQAHGRHADRNLVSIKCRSKASLSEYSSIGASVRSRR